MTQATKEKEGKAVTTKRPSELAPRTQEFERWVDRIMDEFWRRPFPSLLRRDRWWPTEAGLMTRIPPVDVYEEKDEIIAKVELPGFAKEDVTVQVMDSTVTIKGEKKREEEVKEEDYYSCERSFGSFTRSLDLPTEVKTEQVKASFKNGVLEIRMPKTEEAKQKATTIKIE